MKPDIRARGPALWWRRLRPRDDEASVWARLAAGSGLLLSTSGLTGGMNFVSFLLTVHYLATDAFGVLTFSVTTIQLISALMAVGLNETLISLVARADGASRKQEVAALIGASLRVRLTIIMVGFGVGMLAAKPAAIHLFHKPELVLPLFLGVIGACGASLFQFTQAVFLAMREYRRYFAASVLRFLPILIGLALLAASGRMALLPAMLINVLAPFIGVAVSLWFIPFPLISLRHRVMPVWPRLWRMSRWLFLMNLCSMFFSRLEVYLLTAFSSVTQLGIFSAAFDLCGGFMLIEAAARNITLPELSRRAHSDDLGRLVGQCTLVLVGVSACLWLGGALVRPFLGAILGARYSHAAPIFLILVTARVAVLPIIPLTTLFFAAERTRSLALIGLIQLAVLVVAGWVLIPAYGAVGAAWTQLLVTIAAVISCVALAVPMMVNWSAQTEQEEPKRLAEVGS